MKSEHIFAANALLVKPTLLSDLADKLTLHCEVSEHIASCPDSVALHFVIVTGGLDNGLMEGNKQGRRERRGRRENIREVGQRPRGLYSDGQGGGT